MPKSVLVADDSATMRKIIGMVFSTEDFHITVVDNGLDAIVKARDGRPDVVLLDCMMPGKSGYEACEAIKGDPSTQHIPVMLLSGNFEPYDENRARAAGANEHIVKPFDSQAFLDKVKRLVGMPTTAAPVMTYGQVSTGSIAPPANVPQRTQPGVPNPMMGGAPGQPRPMPGPAGIPAGMPRPMQPGGVPMGTQPGIPRPPGVPMGTQPGIPRPPMGAPGGVPMGTQPGVMRPPMQGMPPPGMGGPGMPMRPMTPGAGVPPAGMRPPGGVPTGTSPGFPRPPPGAPLPGQMPPRRDPFGLGGQPQPPPGRAPPPQQPPPQSREQFDLEASIAKDGGEANLRDALSKASREVIEKIAWEVVPQLAETIIREELDRLIKDRETKN